MRIGRLLPVATALVTLTAHVGAQQARVGAHVQSYLLVDAEAVGVDGVTLITFPWTVEAGVVRGVAVSLAGGWARASAKSSLGGSSSVSGILDTDVRVSGAFHGFTVSLEASLPTGRPTSDLEEAAVVGLLATDLLPFRVRRWGMGSELGGRVAYDRLFGRSRVRLALGHSAMSAFTTLEGAWPEYEPGGRTHLSAGVETQVGLASAFSAFLRVERFAEESMGSYAVIDRGDRVTGQLSYSRPIGAHESAMYYVSVSHMGGGTTLITEEGVASLDALPVAKERASRQRVSAGAQMLVTRGKLEIIPKAELSVLRAADGRGQGWIVSLDARARYRLSGDRFGRRLVAEPSFALRPGRIRPYVENSSFVLGWEAGLGLAWTLRP